MCVSYSQLSSPSAPPSPSLAGWLATPITGVYPGLDFEVLITTLIVVVVGGLGNIVGAFWASLLIGGSETFGKAMLPEFPASSSSE